MKRTRMGRMTTRKKKRRISKLETRNVHMEGEYIDVKNVLEVLSVEMENKDHHVMNVVETHFVHMIKLFCKNCCGSFFCPHGRIKSVWKECSGGSICGHGEKKITI
jgi:hypothetical protein